MRPTAPKSHRKGTPKSKVRRRGLRRSTGKPTPGSRLAAWAKDVLSVTPEAIPSPGLRTFHRTALILAGVIVLIGFVLVRLSGESPWITYLNVYAGFTIPLAVAIVVSLWVLSVQFGLPMSRERAASQHLGRSRFSVPFFAGPIHLMLLVIPETIALTRFPETPMTIRLLTIVTLVITGIPIWAILVRPGHWFRRGDLETNEEEA